MAAEFRLLLKDLRQAQELSQDELARQLGISRQSIISLEQGAYLPSFPLLVNLIEFFNCDLDQLVAGLPTAASRWQASLPKIVNQIDNNEKGGEQMMQITRWDPFQAIDRMHDEMNDVVEKTFGRVDWPRTVGSLAGAINIHETDTEYEIQVQVPSFKEEELNLEFSEDTLTISGEHKAEEKQEKKNMIRREWEQSSFSRGVRFAQPIEEAKVEAKLANGTLTIHAPKVEPIKPKVTKITVKK